MKSVLHCGGRGPCSVHIFLIFLLLALLSSPVLADEVGKATDEAVAETAAAQEPPPLPLHQFEGNGGAFTTNIAYLVNPPPKGEVFGLPSIGYIHVYMGYGRNLDCFTATWTLWDRLELGAAWNYFDSGDLKTEVYKATSGAVDLDNNHVQLWHLNARVQIFSDAGPDQWRPAVTVGVHYKYNSTIDDLDKELGGGLTDIGIEDNKGVDFTLYATKTFLIGTHPVCASAGLRATKAAHCGLLGFTDDYTFQGEFNVVTPICDKVWFAAEYKMKPDEYTTVPGLIEEENDWWTIDLAYIANSHLTVAVGYGHFGWILNHRANQSLGIALKYEF